jgi:hypothetical protein
MTVNISTMVSWAFIPCNLLGKGEKSVPLKVCITWEVYMSKYEIRYLSSTKMHATICNINLCLQMNKRIPK